PLIEDTVFDDNGANAGSGLYVSGGAPVLRRVAFRRNGLGALYFADGSTGLVEDALFEHQGVHAVVLASSPVFRRSVFRDNVPGAVPFQGAGALIWEGSP